jgi:hypothetical protein
MQCSVITVVAAIGFWAGQRGVMPAPFPDDGTVALRDHITQLRLQSEADQHTLNELREFMAAQAAELVELRQTLVFYPRCGGARRGRNRGYLAPTLGTNLSRAPAGGR